MVSGISQIQAVSEYRSRRGIGEEVVTAAPPLAVSLFHFRSEVCVSDMKSGMVVCSSYLSETHTCLKQIFGLP